LGCLAGLLDELVEVGRSGGELGSRGDRVSRPRQPKRLHPDERLRSGSRALPWCELDGKLGELEGKLGEEERQEGVRVGREASDERRGEGSRCRRTGPGSGTPRTAPLFRLCVRATTCDRRFKVRLRDIFETQLDLTARG
jgi:hypothetical protein